MTVEDCTLHTNVATLSNGGGIYNYCGELTVLNSNFFDNTAGGYYAYGGGICSRGGTLTVANSAFAKNAGYASTDICSDSEVTTVINSTIVGNLVSSSGMGLPSDYSGVLTLMNSVVSGTLRITLSDDSTNNLIGLDPQFVRNPGTNGPDDYGDLRLRPDSPAIDAGDDSLLPQDLFDLDADGDTGEPIPFDLVGNPRIQDGDADGIATVDIGAYEFFAIPAIPGDLNSDGFVGTPDLDIVRANWGQSVPAGESL